MSIDHLAFELMVQECIESLGAVGIEPYAVHTGYKPSCEEYNVKLAPFLPEGWVAPDNATPYMDKYPWARVDVGAYLTCFMAKHIGDCKLFHAQPPRGDKHVD